MSNANTFGTFLQTLKTLESAQQPSTSWPDKDVYAIANVLVERSGSAPLKTLIEAMKIAPTAFASAVIAGREKGMFEVDDEPEEPVLKLTKLGRALCPP